MIEIENLTKNYNGFRLNVPQLRIFEPQIIILKGKNGTGKTTFLELVLDLVKRDSGSIKLFGKEISSDESWTSKTSAFLNEGFLIGYLKPTEYFSFISMLRNSKGGIKSIVNFNSPFIEQKLINCDQKISDLSKGQKMKIGIIGAFVGNPQIVIFDEPLAHLDHESIRCFIDFIEKYVLANKSIVILSDHGHRFDNINCKVSELVLDKGELVEVNG